MLTREDLRSGSFLKLLEGADEHPLLSQDQLNTSMHRALTLRPPEGPVWLFAYGSLMWNPAIQHVEAVAATVHGWRRSFCIRMVAGRGTRGAPGRMLALEEGGSAQGLALRLPDDGLLEELQLVWTREMAGGVYRPVWAPARFHAERTAATVLTFVADTTHPLFVGNETARVAAKSIAGAAGPLGTNLDYVEKLVDALKANKLSDCYVETVASELEQCSA